MSTAATPIPATPRLTLAWLLFCSALALHVTDEALTGFLNVWNPTTLAMRARFSWWPMPLFGFSEWLGGLAVLVVGLVALTPVVTRNLRRIWPVVGIFAVMMIGNGTGHILGTIFGRTVAEVRFPRPMPGFYSSPLLIAASIYLLVQIRRMRKA